MIRVSSVTRASTAPWPGVKPAEVRDVTGDGLEAPLPLAALLAEVTARWDAYFILPAGAATPATGRCSGSGAACPPGDLGTPGRNLRLLCS